MRSVISGILSGCLDLAGRRRSFRAPCGLFHTPAAVEPCRKTAKKCENGLRISQTAYHAVCFSTRFSTGCGKVLPSCVGNGKENVGLPRRGLPRLAAVVPGGGRGGFGRRLTLPLWCLKWWLAFFAACLPCLQFIFLPPIPPTPFPGGEGGDSKFISPGAEPPGTPALNHLRHLQNPPSKCPAEESLLGVADCPRRCPRRRGLPRRFSFHALTGAAGCDILVYRTEPPRRTARKQKETPYRTAIPERRKGEKRA